MPTPARSCLASPRQALAVRSCLVPGRSPGRCLQKMTSTPCPLLPLAILLIIAIATVLWMTLHVPKGHAALSGTILDFVQTFCIFTLLPAAVISSGLSSLLGGQSCNG